MSKNLVIVESPAKAKTIGRYLGNQYRIAASVGHIRDLPSSSLGVDVENKYHPQYVSMKGKEKVIHELKDMAKSADSVLIATDPDREGEAIAWHLAQILKIDAASSCRISFNEITEPAVKRAVGQPRPIDMDLVNSQQARRILDRLVGYELSPLLWKKVKKGLSAGRVQSVATRIVVEREREIQAFKPEEYWLLTAWLHQTPENPLFRARYYGEIEQDKLKKVKLSNKEETDSVVNDLPDRPFAVWQLKKSTRQRKPSAPFTTSTLQQEAARFLGYTARRTMSVAQQLYEGVELGSESIALVTYIRTDSVRVSDEAEQEARRHIHQKFGEDYLPRAPHRYKNKNASQDAHEAIRPAHFDMEPEQIKDQLSYDQFRLYRLIWDKFMASQMAPAVIDTVTADIAAGSHVFRAQGETIRFPGYMAQYGVQLVDQEAEKNQDDDANGKEKLPELSDGEKLLLQRLDPEQKFTQPPPRYTEATLIKAMEDKGIGRPSTYAPTVSTILDRLYVEKDGKHLVPTELGKTVTVLLEEHFTDIVDVTFTARMEGDLDTVESGEQDWVSLLDSFYPSFHQLIEKASTIDRVKIADIPTGEKCPDCHEGDLVIKEGRFGKFIACSRYPECRFTRNIENAVKGKCPLCGSGLVSRASRKYKGSHFYTCDKQGTDPECPFISWDLPIEGQHCETCGTYMVWKRFRGRSFPRCGNRDCPTNQKRNKDTAADDAEDVVTDTVSDQPEVKKSVKKNAAKKTAAKITAAKKTTAKKSAGKKAPAKKKAAGKTAAATGSAATPKSNEPDQADAT
ncbi:MAG: type I DNA topoisomerase [Bacillota bacterium]|nr:type I DNA topoisomerase [Bacillota bacterium]